MGLYTLFVQTVFYGLPESAPFDRILISAAAGEITDELFKQLKAGGRSRI